MVNIELQNLIKRLTPHLKSTLEIAAGDCLARTHFTIELEHWFIALLQGDNTVWHQAMVKTGHAKETVVNQLNQKLSSLARGNDSSPSLSPELVQLLKDSWMLASLDHADGEINEYHLLLVLKQRASEGHGHAALESWLNSISSAWLSSESSTTAQASTPSSSSAPAASSAAPGSTTALDSYTKNLTQAARDGELDPVIGRGAEVRKAIDILCRRRQNSPILVGEPGVGKTAIVEGLAQQIVAGDVPPALANVELRSLDLSLLQAGASIKGEFENRLKDIINEIKQSATPIIIFIDEAHTLIGAGGAAGQNDAANILKPALARGEFRSIAATTWAEYKQYFETDAALTRRFQVVAVNEPNEQDCIEMLRGVKVSLEKHHKVKIRTEAIEAAVSLSVRYLPERKLPDKAISLLDTACSRIGLSQSATPYELDELTAKISYTQREIEAIEHEHELWSADNSKLVELEETLTELTEQQQQLEARWQKEKTLVEQVVSLQEQLAEQINDANLTVDSNIQQQLKDAMAQLEQLQGEQPLVLPQVNQQTVAQVIALWTGIPVGNMLKKEVEQLMHLEDQIGKRVIGQTAPINEISQAIRMSRAGLTDPRKPVGVFLMCGPSGVGKTETALALTDLLYGGEKNITTINMTEFKEEHKISMLLGSPAGYVGFGKGGVLTEAVRKNPYSVLLLDEMEKAHPGVHDVFYQIFDKGCIADSEGRNIDFRNTIIIMTSNAADSAVVNACEDERPSVSDLTKTIFPELQRYFKPAFLGRATIVPYFPLNEEEMGKIVKISLARIKRRVSEHYGASFSYSDDIISQLVSLNNSPETGARAVEQIINRKLMPQLANMCIARMSEALPIKHIEVNLVNGDFTFDIK